MIRIVTTAKDRRGKLIGIENPGPYEITEDHNNGTITIRCGNFLERINIRRVKRVNKKEKDKEKDKIKSSTLDFILGGECHASHTI